MKFMVGEKEKTSDLMRIGTTSTRPPENMNASKYKASLALLTLSQEG